MTPLNSELQPTRLIDRPLTKCLGKGNAQLSTASYMGTGQATQRSAALAISAQVVGHELRHVIAGSLDAVSLINM